MFKLHNRVKVVNVDENEVPFNACNGKTGYIFKIWKTGIGCPYEIIFDDADMENICFNENELELISEV